MPFREAHGVVGDLVRRALDDGRPLSELERDELASFSELLDDEYYEVLSTERALESKRSAGGTAPAASPTSSARPSRRSPRCPLERRPAGRRRAVAAGADPIGEPLDADFFARSVHDVAADLVGCALLFDGVGGVIVETESYDATDPACHAYGGITPRSEVAVRPAGPRLRLLLLRRPQPAQRGRRARGPRRRGADPGARAARGGSTRCARAAAAASRASCARARASSPRRSASASSTTGRRSTARRSCSARRAGRYVGVEVTPAPRIGISRAVDYPWRFCAAGSSFLSRPMAPARASRGLSAPRCGATARRRPCPCRRPRSGRGAAGAAGAALSAGGAAGSVGRRRSRGGGRRRRRGRRAGVGRGRARRRRRRPCRLSGRRDRIES